MLRAALVPFTEGPVTDMTQIGTVIEEKYEILKEIGRGGMSVVYLANDTRLNRNWAVKEVRKKGNGKNDEVIINSLLAEANMVKRLDHPALPRIVDIIDNGETIYIVMDFIEGEPLSKILGDCGPQPEEKVIGWAMQICDVLSYLHSQKPPVIYRDMKPANIMLKPNGNISIIDFGIAREYKEQNPADTTILGTKGYAPPEQYTGQTDARSDIYALGMTMHHLLTGVDPGNGGPCKPVRQLNPGLSEGIETIIAKCVEPAAENRYQSCDELLTDLQDPDRVTRGWRKRQKSRAGIFFAAAGSAVIAAAAGIIFLLAATSIKNQDYDLQLNSSDPAGYYEAVSVYPGRTQAYEQLIEYYKNHGTGNDEIVRIGNQIEKNAEQLDISRPEVARLYYDMGKLYFAYFDGTLKTRAANAQNFFKIAAGDNGEFDKKDIAACYYSVCRFMTGQSATAEHALSDYTELFDEITGAMSIVDSAGDSEANYDKITLYYVTLLLINDQSRYMAGVGFDRQTALDLMEGAYNRSVAVTSTLSYVIGLRERIISDYPDFIFNVNSNYDEVAKRQGGDQNG